MSAAQVWSQSSLWACRMGWGSSAGLALHGLQSCTPALTRAQHTRSGLSLYYSVTSSWRCAFPIWRLAALRENLGLHSETDGHKVTGGPALCPQHNQRTNLLSRDFLTRSHQAALLPSQHSASDAHALTSFLPSTDSAGDLRWLAEPHSACHSTQAEHCREGTQHHCAGQGPRGAAGLTQGAHGRRRSLFQAGAETNPGARGE